MTVRIVGMPCTDPHERGCQAPARELGQFCTACWLGMTGNQRSFERMYFELDPLEKIATLPNRKM